MTTETRPDEIARPGSRYPLPADPPNSGPGGRTGAYDRLTESFEDAYAARSPATEQPTCCQASDLRNEDPRGARHVDHVLYRGDLSPTAVETVGTDAESWVQAEVDGESVTLWPSDHAGVVATLAVSTATPTPTPTASTPNTATVEESQRGLATKISLYGGAAGIGGLSLAALTWYRNAR